MTVVHTSNVTEKNKVFHFMLLTVLIFSLNIVSFFGFGLKKGSVFAFLVLKILIGLGFKNLRGMPLSKIRRSTPPPRGYMAMHLTGCG